MPLHHCNLFCSQEAPPSEDEASEVEGARGGAAEEGAGRGEGKEEETMDTFLQVWRGGMRGSESVSYKLCY